MENKKLTKAQLESRMNNSPLFLKRTKSTKSIFFYDKGLRLTIDSEEGYALIETGYHSHMFRNFTMAGVSQPWVYTQWFIDVAYKYDCKTEEGYSYAKLMELIKDGDEQDDYIMASVYDWYLFNIFKPLYSIGISTAEYFMTYEAYIHNIACQCELLKEKTEDVTNKDFIAGVIKRMEELTKDVEEQVVFHKLTDEELMQENIKAISEMENAEFMEESLNKEQEQVTEAQTNGGN